MRHIAARLTGVGRRPENRQKKLVTAVLTAAALVMATGLGSVALAAVTEPPSVPNGYTLVATIPLPGPAGHGDWVAYDAGNGYIYVSHHGSNLVVVDPTKNTVVANVESPELKTPDVMTFDANRVYVTAEDAQRIVVISKKDWTIAGSVRTMGRRRTASGWIRPWGACTF